MTNWEQPSTWGICMSGDPESADAAFNAGHLEDVLVIGRGPILLAGPTSGVRNTSTSASNAFNFTTWFPQNNINVLGLGTYSNVHVYAGGDALYETDTTHAFPLANWRQISVNDVDGNAIKFGGVLDIVALRGANLGEALRVSKLVLACGNGILWSFIPPIGGTYEFKWAAGQPVGQVGFGFSGITEWPNHTVVASVWGNGDATNSGVFTGQFNVTGPSASIP